MILFTRVLRFSTFLVFTFLTLTNAMEFYEDKKVVGYSYGESCLFGRGFYGGTNPATASPTQPTTTDDDVVVEASGTKQTLPTTSFDSNDKAEEGETKDAKAQSHATIHDTPLRRTTFYVPRSYL